MLLQCSFCLIQVQRSMCRFREITKFSETVFTSPLGFNFNSAKNFIHRKKHAVLIPRCLNKTEAEVLAH